MTEITLVVGDPHVQADDNLRRFKALSNYIADLLPDNIVLMGDFLTLDSLSEFDRDKRAKMENKRLWKELAHGKEAMDIIMSGIERYNNNQRLNKKRLYSPTKIYIEGNHEDRFFRYMDYRPELQDMADIYKEIGVYCYDWELIKYRRYKFLDGIGFCHVPMNGVNNPVGGIYANRKITNDHDHHVVYGHSHQFRIDTFTRRGPSSKQVMAINAGCFFEGNFEYSTGSLLSEDWWRGVVVLEHHGNGTFDIHTKRLDSLLRGFL